MLFEKRFEDGEEVYAIAHPSVPLIVRRYIDRVYYCRVRDDATQKEQVYYDRELVAPKQK